MNLKNLIVCNLKQLYNILDEISLNLNLNIIHVNNENSLKNKIENMSNYLIITDRKYQNIDYQFILDFFPINIFKFTEKINTEFLKFQFNKQSNIKINDYDIDLNAREIIKKNVKLKLTEKEINTIIYLSKSTQPVGINDLQKKVWSYQFNTETHTVETHIYRLRKKMLKVFNDNLFITSEKNGYQIK